MIGRCLKTETWVPAGKGETMSENITLPMLLKQYYEVTSKWAYHFNPKFLMLFFNTKSFKNGELCFRYKAQEYPTYLPFISTQIQKCETSVFSLRNT